MGNDDLLRGPSGVRMILEVDDIRQRADGRDEAVGAESARPDDVVGIGRQRAALRRSLTILGCPPTG